MIYHKISLVLFAFNNWEFLLKFKLESVYGRELILALPYLKGCFVSLDWLCVEGRQTNKQTDKQTDRQTNRQTNKQTDKQTNKRTNKQTEKQTDRQTNRKTNRKNKKTK